MEIKDVDIARIDNGADYVPDKGLVENIKSVGVKVPVFLSENGNGSFTVIDGRRRISAARVLGLETVPAVVLNGETSPLLGVMLNIHRSPNPGFEAEKIKELIDAGYTQEGIAKALNTNKTKLKRHFHLLNLCEEGLKRLKNGKIRPSVALELSRLSIETQEKILSESERLTSKTVQKARRNFNFEKFNLSFEEGTGVETGTLATEFETFVSKISVGRILPEEVQKAVEVLRRFINGG